MTEYTYRELVGRMHEAETTLYTTMMTYTANGQIEYVGEAEPGSSTGSTVWRIKKLAYDGGGFQTSITWASGNRNFDKEWDERATYVYS